MLLLRDLENSCLALEPADETGLARVLGSSITYRIVVGPHQGRKACSLQTLTCTGSYEESSARVAMSWARHRKRVFRIDIETCQACGGALKMVTSIQDLVRSAKFWHIRGKRTRADKYCGYRSCVCRPAVGVDVWHTGICEFTLTGKDASPTDGRAGVAAAGWPVPHRGVSKWPVKADGRRAQSACWCPDHKDSAARIPVRCSAPGWILLNYVGYPSNSHSTTWICLPINWRITTTRGIFSFIFFNFWLPRVKKLNLERFVALCLRSHSAISSVSGVTVKYYRLFTIWFCSAKLLITVSQHEYAAQAFLDYQAIANRGAKYQ